MGDRRAVSRKGPGDDSKRNGGEPDKTEDDDAIEAASRISRH